MFFFFSLCLIAATFCFLVINNTLVKCHSKQLKKGGGQGGRILLTTKQSVMLHGHLLPQKAGETMKL